MSEDEIRERGGGEEEEGEDEDSETSCESKPDEDQIRHKDLLKLKEYLTKLAYRVNADLPNEFPRTTQLAKPHPKSSFYIHHDFKDYLKPDQRKKRIKKAAFCQTFITTEEFELKMRATKIREEMKSKAKNRRSEIFLSVLDKLEQQCRESAMRDIVDKFATYLADRCVKKHLPSIMTESFQRLTRGLVCNMYISLGIAGNKAKPDHSIYETIAFVLADLILEAHFQLQTNALKPEDLKRSPDISAEIKLDCLKQRALRASQKLTNKKYCRKLGEDFNRFLALQK